MRRNLGQSGLCSATMGSMTERAAGPTSEPTETAGARVCQWPGCTQLIEWNGRGRPPAWCQQVVDDVRHTAVNAHRHRGGARQKPARSLVEGLDHVDDERPVSRARGELGRVSEAITASLTSWRNETAAHELRMRALVDAAAAAVAEL